jgi:hypothetical protein
VEIFNTPVPLPISTVGLRYGLDGRSDLHVATHVSSLGLFRLAGLEVGLSRLLVEPKGPRPALVVDGTFLAFTGDAEVDEPNGGAAVYADLAGLASWSWTSCEHLLYIGAHLFVQPLPFQAHAALLLGNRWRLSQALGLVTELRWIDPWQDTRAWTLHYYGVNGRGAFQVLLGLHWRPSRFQEGASR